MEQIHSKHGFLLISKWHNSTYHTNEFLRLLLLNEIERGACVVAKHLGRNGSLGVLRTNVTQPTLLATPPSTLAYAACLCALLWL